MKRLGIIALAVTLTLTGSGSVGDILDWSVQEDATPVSPGDTSGSVGNVNVSAERGTDPEFIVDNASVFTHDRLGYIEGKVDTLNANGATDEAATSIPMTLTTPLSRLNVERTYGPFTGTLSDYFNVLVGLGSIPSWITSWGDTLGPVSGFNLLGGMAVDPVDGSIYIGGSRQADGNRRVIKYSSNGDYILAFGATGSGDGQFSATSSLSIAVSPVDQTVYVTDEINSRVQQFTSAGVYVTKWGTTGTGNGQFAGAIVRGVAVDSAGAVYVYDRGTTSPTNPSDRVQKFTSSGTYTTSWTGGGMYMTVDSTGNIWAVGQLASPGTDYLREFTNTGTLVAQYGNNLNGGDLGSNPSGIAVDSEDRIYVTVVPYDLATSGFKVAIQRFSPDGTVLDGWGRDGTANGQYDNGVSDNTAPAGIALWKNGDLLEVLDGVLVRVNMYSINSVSGFSFSTDYEADNNPAVIFRGWIGNVWKMLKDLCSAFSVELSTINGAIQVRDIGDTILSLEDVITDSPKFSLDSSATGLSVSIQNYNTSSGTGTIYNAFDSGKIFTIQVGQTTTETILTNNYPVVLDQPTNGYLGQLPTI